MLVKRGQTGSLIMGGGIKAIDLGGSSQTQPGKKAGGRVNWLAQGKMWIIQGWGGGGGYNKAGGELSSIP